MIQALDVGQHCFSVQLQGYEARNSFIYCLATNTENLARFVPIRLHNKRKLCTFKHLLGHVERNADMPSAQEITGTGGGSLKD